MKKTITDNRQLIHYDRGEDFAFNGCLKYLFECLGESSDYDFWFFGGVTGDSFTQIYIEDLNIRPMDLSQASFDEELIKRVFTAVGYSYEFVDNGKLAQNIAYYQKCIIDSIDRGIPVIVKGFDSVSNGYTYYRANVGCIVGYDTDEKNTFYYITQENSEPKTFLLDKDYILVFTGEKVDSPILADVYKKAVFNIPYLNTMPRKNGVSFGSQAFLDWAFGIENGKYDNIPDEKLDLWVYYAQYLVIYSTQICGQHFMQRVKNLCPDLELLVSELQLVTNEKYDNMGDFNTIGEGFNLDVRKLKDKEYMKPICNLIRKCASLNDRYIEIIKNYDK